MDSLKTYVPVPEKNSFEKVIILYCLFKVARILDVIFLPLSRDFVTFYLSFIIVNGNILNSMCSSYIENYS